jgi:SnoaL-like protein
MDSAFAQHFANEWIAAWNAHDLDRVLSHYANGLEMSSPYIVALAGEPSGTLIGKPAVEAYWRRALGAFPELHFDLVSALMGANSIALYYKGARGRVAAEVFHFDAEQKISRAFAHYEIQAVP